MTEHSKRVANRLINETSPYLLQHAYNPVDWHPWGPEALELAKKQKRLILLSVGYSACHWCHVMERESFEDGAIAEIMNRHYVCIKVDREERPDLDKIYQTAHQLFNRRPGGWPLTAFLTYDEQIPVFVGTYFPNVSRHGMPAFNVILENIAQQFKETQDKLPEHTRIVKDAFRQIDARQTSAEVPFDESHMTAGVDNLLRDYDPVYGGFGQAPKFPHGTQLKLMLAFCQRDLEDENTRNAAMNASLHTLEAMACGGLYDQIGGGFYRYCVDAKWEIPHFEKMLYDNAQLIPMYIHFGKMANRSRFLEIASESADWVMREMQSPRGGYYSTLDADSEGEEGKFYVWTVDEVKDILHNDEYAAAVVRFGLRGTPNFEGSWHLTAVNSISTVAERTGQPVDTCVGLLNSTRTKLFGARSKRIRPARDDKILASWNGLMIKAMACAGRVLQRPDLIRSADEALEFVKSRMWQDGRLLATAMDDVARLNAYLDDYAFLADGVLELLQARWRTEDLNFAMALIDVLLDKFVDESTGAFCFTSDDHETLIHRTVPTHDDATPSGNGVAAEVLIRFGYLTGETRYIERAEQVLKSVLSTSVSIPSAYGSAIAALEDLINPGPVVIVSGEHDQAIEWARAVSQDGTSKSMVFLIPGPNDESLPPLLREKASSGTPVAYVCTGYTCSSPTHSLPELLLSLDGS